MNNLTLDSFVGSNARNQAKFWLNEFFDGVASKGIVIFYGVSGNGKTILAKLLAEAYDVELFSICPFDIKGEDSLNDFIKSLNSKPLTKEKKIVLIDDIDDFSIRYRKKLLGVSSVYPIIYTTKNLHKDTLSDEFKSKCQIIKVKKPLTSEIIDHLKTRCSFPIEKIDEIAKKSKSVRSAELSIYNESINELINPPDTYSQMITEMKQRCLTKTVNRDNIKTIFRSIKGYDEDSLKVREKLAEMDFRIKYKYEEIDPWFVNNMIEPIEDVIEYKDYKRNNKKKPKKVVRETVEKIPEKKKMVSIDDFI